MRARLPIGDWKYRRRSAMILQISSGQGPKECEMAVGKLFGALKEEYLAAILPTDSERLLCNYYLFDGSV